jgi:Uma2 family endonuclease
VIEVAVSSSALDRENASLYAEAGVAEYWIVLCRERQIEAYLRPVKGLYQEKRIYAAEETISCGAVSALEIRLSDLFK